MGWKLGVSKEWERLKNWRRDLGSKLLDGLLVFVLTFLAMLLLSLLVEPFRMLLGKPGLLIYALVLLAASIFCLDRGLIRRKIETQTRSVWFGVASGISSWVFVKISGEIGALNLDNAASALLLLLALLVSLTFWRRGLPLGGSFFLSVFLLNWIAQFVATGWHQLENSFAYLQHLSDFFGYLFLAALLSGLVGIFFYTDTPLQRSWFAIAMWFFLTLIVYAFWGQVI